MMKHWVPDVLAGNNHMDEIYTYGKKLFTLQPTFDTQNKVAKHSQFLKPFLDNLLKKGDEMDLSFIHSLRKMKTHSKQSDLAILKAIAKKHSLTDFKDFLRNIAAALPSDKEQMETVDEPQPTTVANTAVAVSVDEPQPATIANTAVDECVDTIDERQPANTPNTAVAEPVVTVNA